MLNGFPIERRKVWELTKAPWNPRRIAPEQAAALKRSMQEFGTVEPIVVNKTTGHIVGGHMRLVAVWPKLTEEQRKDTATVATAANLPQYQAESIVTCARLNQLIYDDGRVNEFAQKYLVTYTAGRLKKTIK